MTTLRLFLRGARAPWDGLRHMLRHPALWRYAVIPILLNLAITATVLVLAVIAAVAVGRWLHPMFDDGGWGWTGRIAAYAGLAVATLGATAAVWVLLQGMLCGYFYGLLAREVELQLGLPPDQLREVSLGYQVVDALRDFAVLVAANGGLLLLNCVPVVGSVAAFCGAAWFNSLIFGRDYLNYPLDLRGLRRQEKLVILRRHRAESLGLGAVVLAVNFVPLVGPVLLTTAATGAVLLHRTWEDGTVAQ
jgi:CysZ protein